MTDAAYDRVPLSEDVDLERPSAARIYDWYLGGVSNYAVDRQFGQRAVGVWPDVKGVARLNRRWLGRVVAEAVRAGFTQFLDIGAGLPTEGNTHQVARHTAGPDADLRVVYVDNEQVAHAYATVMLEQDDLGGWCTAILEDARNPEAIFDHPGTRGLLDPAKPVCVLTVALWQFVGGADDVPALLARYRGRLASGSWIRNSPVGPDDAPAENQAQIEQLRLAYRDTQNPLWVRGHDELAAWFEPMPLVEPGLTHLTRWRPDTSPANAPADAEEAHEQERMGRAFWCGVGQIR